jgi:hypothetical protein
MNGTPHMMNATRSITTALTVDPELAAAIRGWKPRMTTSVPPEVAVEPRPEGLRVKLTYLGVESGVMFAWGTTTTGPAVQGTLDRLFDVLSWRVVRRPEAQ